MLRTLSNAGSARFAGLVPPKYKDTSFSSSHRHKSPLTPLLLKTSIISFHRQNICAPREEIAHQHTKPPSKPHHGELPFRDPAPARGKAAALAEYPVAKRTRLRDACRSDNGAVQYRWRNNKVTGKMVSRRQNDYLLRQILWRIAFLASGLQPSSLAGASRYALYPETSRSAFLHQWQQCTHLTISPNQRHNSSGACRCCNTADIN